jgi:hypothetical protein
MGVSLGVAATQAATTIGQTGTPTSDTYSGGFEQADTSYVVPAGGGTIVSLNTQAANGCSDVGEYNLHVLRPLGGDQYRVLGETGHKTDPCDGQLHSYPVTIPVQAGDILGVYVISDWEGALSGGSRVFARTSEPAVGSIVTMLPRITPVTLDVSAALTTEPQRANDCKNGGWKNFTDANGNSFKNQGDCVSYVASKGKNPAG